jgi:hypothetical protein
VTVYVFRNGKIVEKSEQPPQSGGFFMPDIKEFRSPIDGSIISSRKHLRDHERAYGVKQVGNDTAPRSSNERD